MATNQSTLSTVVLEALKKHLQEQQARVIEVQELLEFLSRHEQGPLSGPVAVASRALADICDALDRKALNSIVGPAESGATPPERLNA